MFHRQKRSVSTFRCRELCVTTFYVSFVENAPARYETFTCLDRQSCFQYLLGQRLKGFRFREGGGGGWMYLMKGSVSHMRFMA